MYGKNLARFWSTSFIGSFEGRTLKNKCDIIYSNKKQHQRPNLKGNCDRILKCIKIFRVYKCEVFIIMYLDLYSWSTICCCIWECQKSNLGDINDQICI